MSRLKWLEGVDDDIFEITAYLKAQSEELAERFVSAVQKTLKDVAQHPGMGSPKSFETPGLQEVRSWWVEGFPNHLIFYLPLADGAEVIAVIHGARDIEKYLRRRIW